MFHMFQRVEYSLGEELDMTVKEQVEVLNAMRKRLALRIQ